MCRHGDARTYDWQDWVEDVERYKPGGFHPTVVGDVLSDGRYKIVHKLGFGGFSTVWLARDQLSNRYVSIKIKAANDKRPGQEINLLRHLDSHDPEHPGRSYVQTILDHFEFDGPNGHHECIVTHVNGPSIREIKEAVGNDFLYVTNARRITQQLAQGLSYIHAAGIVHGDLHLDNVVTRLPNIDAWSIGRLYEVVGEPMKQGVSRCDRDPLGPEAPSHTVVPISEWDLDHDELAQNIQIVDFGEAAFFGDERNTSLTPLPWRPPESAFGEAIAAPADMWAFACLVFDFFSKTSLNARFTTNEKSMILNLIQLLGPLPKRWQAAWTTQDEKFSPAGNSRPLSSRILEIEQWRSKKMSKEDASTFNAELRKTLENYLSPILKFEPSERAAITQILTLRSP